MKGGADLIFNVTGKLLDTCVLSLLEKKDTYGYDLTQTIGKYMEISESTLYPVLRRLMKEGHLESYNQEHDGRNRKYYHITESGLQLLIEYRGDWKQHKHILEQLIEGGNDL